MKGRLFMYNENSKKLLNLHPNEAAFLKKYNFVILNKNLSHGKSYPSHWHDYFECEIVLEGSANHGYNNTNYRIFPGYAYLLSYVDTHSVTPLTNMKIFSVCFNENFLPNEITDIISVKARSCSCFFSSIEMAYITKRIERINSIDINIDFYQHTVTAMITEIILLILQKSNISDSTITPSLTQQTISYIMRHFREHISLNSISKQLLITPKHLGVVFKKNTDMSFNEYLNNVRLEYACNLLITSDLLIKEIAFSSGYTSVEYFLDIFKKMLKMTPSEYRKQNLMQQNNI